MKNNNKNDTWINLFLFFLVTDKPETVLDLIQSDNCEKEFTDIVQRIVTMDSKWFQHTCIDWLMKHREILMELNKAYKISQDVLDKVRAEVESQRKEVSNKNTKNNELQAFYDGLNDGLKDARDIIDKYKADKEEQSTDEVDN